MRREWKLELSCVHNSPHFWWMQVIIVLMGSHALWIATWVVFICFCMPCAWQLELCSFVLYIFGACKWSSFWLVRMRWEWRLALRSLCLYMFGACMCSSYWLVRMCYAWQLELRNPNIHVAVSSEDRTVSTSMTLLARIQGILSYNDIVPKTRQSQLQWPVSS